MNTYPIEERIFNNANANGDFAKINVDLQCDIACIGMTYSGTGHLMRILEKSPCLSPMRKVYDLSRRAKIYRYVHYLSKVFGKRLEVLTFPYIHKLLKILTTPPTVVFIFHCIYDICPNCTEMEIFSFLIRTFKPCCFQ